MGQVRELSPHRGINEWRFIYHMGAPALVNHS
jgi:hypothetical protein